MPPGDKRPGVAGGALDPPEPQAKTGLGVLADDDRDCNLRRNHSHERGAPLPTSEQTKRTNTLRRQMLEAPAAGLQDYASLSGDF
jgi:hypothetical protein